MNAALVLLAENVPDDDLVTPGVGGFAVFFLLAVACFFLFRSFAKHLRRARANADEMDRRIADESGEHGEHGEHGETPGDEQHRTGTGA